MFDSVFISVWGMAMSISKRLILSTQKVFCVFSIEILEIRIFSVSASNISKTSISKSEKCFPKMESPIHPLTKYGFEPALVSS
jgi:hypothetical protein